MKIFYLLLLLLSSLRIWSQNEYNNCYFGEKVGLNFNSNPPTVLLNSSIPASDPYTPYATYSDHSGNLLFYTDGHSVWNKQHQLMEDGQFNIGLQSDEILIVPFTNENLKFYILYLSTHDTNLYTLKYSVVDLSFNNGLGKVSSKDHVIKQGVAVMLACIKHSNNHDYWLISKQDWNENLSTNLYLFQITDKGVSTTYTSIPTTSIALGGAIMPSPDGSKIAVYSLISGTVGQYQVSISDFNRTTGKLSNTLNIDLGFFHFFDTSASNAVISPDNSKLYLQPYQYNLQAGSIKQILESKIVVFPEDLPQSSGLQVMPDGKLYVFKSETPYLDVINEPNKLGTLCGYSENAIDLQHYNCIGLYPKIIAPLDISQIRISTNQHCISDQTTFQLTNTARIQSVLWNFGDGQTSTELAPSHQYAHAGNYAVTLNVTFTDNSTQTISKMVEIFEKPTKVVILHD